MNLTNAFKKPRWPEDPILTYLNLLELSAIANLPRTALCLSLILRLQT